MQRQALTHLLLVLPLRVESRLDALPGLLEGLSLGDLGRVVGADAHDVGAGENEDIGDKLQRERRGGTPCSGLEPTPVIGAPTLTLPAPEHEAPRPHLSRHTPSCQQINAKEAESSQASWVRLSDVLRAHSLAGLRWSVALGMPSH